MLESLKSAAAIYLVFLCCQPLFFPPENILSVVYEPSLFLSQIPNAPVYVYPVFSFLLPPFFPPFLPALLSLSLSLFLSHTHTHTYTYTQTLFPGMGLKLQKEPKKRVVFKVSIRSWLVGAWLETGLGRGGDFFAGGSQPVFVWKLGTRPVPTQRIAWPPAQWWIWLSFPYPQWGSRQATKQDEEEKNRAESGKKVGGATLEEGLSWGGGGLPQSQGLGESNDSIRKSILCSGSERKGRKAVAPSLLTLRQRWLKSYFLT